MQTRSCIYTEPSPRGDDETKMYESMIFVRETVSLQQRLANVPVPESIDVSTLSTVGKTQSKSSLVTEPICSGPL
jgi:hypothetical protein